VTGLDDERAWTVRERAFTEAPVAALDSLYGLGCERAWSWRERHLERAPKIVLRTLTGMAGERARKMCAQAAPRCKEAIDALIGADDEAAWTLRERHADDWPSTVAKSMASLGRGKRGRALLARLGAHHPHDVALAANAALIDAGGTVAQQIGIVTSVTKIK
jgi:hypothetical protein